MEPLTHQVRGVCGDLHHRVQPLEPLKRGLGPILPDRVVRRQELRVQVLVLQRFVVHHLGRKVVSS